MGLTANSLRKENNENVFNRANLNVYYTVGEIAETIVCHGNAKIVSKALPQRIKNDPEFDVHLYKIEKMLEGKFVKGKRRV